MNISIPPTSVVQEQLSALTHAEMQQVSAASGVPFTTLWKIRDGTTKNPGMETVRKFVPHIPSAPEAPTNKSSPA